jgi:hypothetical protein
MCHSRGNAQRADRRAAVSSGQSAAQYPGLVCAVRGVGVPPDENYYIGINHLVVVGALGHLLRE